MLSISSVLLSKELKILSRRISPYLDTISELYSDIQGWMSETADVEQKPDGQTPVPMPKLKDGKLKGSRQANDLPTKESRLEIAWLVWTDTLREQLISIPPAAPQGKAANDMVGSMDDLFEQQRGRKQSDVFLSDVEKRLDDGRQLVGQYLEMIRLGIDRLSQAFTSGDVQAFELELGNFARLSPDDTRLQDWYAKRSVVQEFSKAKEMAEKARLQRTPQKEIEALARIIKLGFGTQERKERLSALKARQHRDRLNRAVSDGLAALENAGHG